LMLHLAVVSLERSESGSKSGKVSGIIVCDAKVVFFIVFSLEVSRGLSRSLEVSGGLSRSGEVWSRSVTSPVRQLVKSPHLAARAHTALGYEDAFVLSC